MTAYKSEIHVAHLHTLIDVFVDDLVDLFAQLVRDLGLLGFHELAHHRHDVLAALRFGVGEVQIVKRHILNHFLLLVHIA